jgi:hypothetical protein
MRGKFGDMLISWYFVKPTLCLGLNVMTHAVSAHNLTRHLLIMWPTFYNRMMWLASDNRTMCLTCNNRIIWFVPIMILLQLACNYSFKSSVEMSVFAVLASQYNDHLLYCEVSTILWGFIFNRALASKILQC